MPQDLLTETQQEFDLVDEPPARYYTLELSNGMRVRGITKQWFHQGIMIVGGTGEGTISIPSTAYTWSVFDNDITNYVGPLYIENYPRSNTN